MFVSLLLFVLEIWLVVSVDKCDRTFQNCNFKCHCKNNEQCDSQSGICPNGCAHDKAKDDSWMGPGCQYPMIDGVGGSTKVNNMLATLNVKPISSKNLKRMERRAGDVIETISKESSKRAAKDAFQMEMADLHTDVDIEKLPEAIPRGDFKPVKAVPGKSTFAMFDLETTDLSDVYLLAQGYDQLRDHDIETCQPGILEFVLFPDSPRLMTGLILYLKEFEGRWSGFRVTISIGHVITCYDHPNDFSSSEVYSLSRTDMIEIDCVSPSGLQSVTLTFYNKANPCELYLFAGREVAFNKPTNASSTYLRWSSSKAVDGIYPDESNMDKESSSCFASNYQKSWLVNLRHGYDIHEVYFYARYNYQSQTEDVYIDGITPDGTSWRIYTDNERFDENRFHPLRVTLSVALKNQQYIRVERPMGANNVMTICELKVIAECPVDFCGWNCEMVCKCALPAIGVSKIVGRCLACKNRWFNERRYDRHCSVECIRSHWGEDCDKSCGHCETNTCDFLTGLCEHSCTGHYKFPLCVDVCDGHTWGNNCSKSCSHCEGARQCDPELGHCSRCEPFWRPPFCDIECLNNEWGQQCEHACGHCEGICDKTNGHCEHSCTGAWKLPLCVDACDAGTYGKSCSQTCNHCEHGNPCDIQNGNCDRCEPGWKLPLCQIECDAGRYGQDCAELCGNCEGGNLCDAATGECYADCQPGWNLPLCKQGCIQTQWGRNCRNMCGKCLEFPCDVTNGHCKTGCSGTMKPRLCIAACDAGTYGRNCDGTCGHCEHGNPCDIQTGNCDRCEPAWKLPLCQIACLNNEWGQRCEHACGHCEGICDKTNGHCEHSCTGAWKLPLCVDACDAGTYGKSCSQTCGHCEQGNPCDIQNGNCPAGCELGWNPPLCSHDCDSGTFGAGCSGTCGHCKQGVTCDARNGYCPAGCDGHWTPPKCSTGGPVVTDRNSNYTCLSWKPANCQLDCPVWGVPEPEVLWNKKDGAFSQEGISASFTMLTKASGGVYECTASIGAASVSADVTLTMMYPPMNTAANGSRTDFVVGQRLLLNCPFDCIPYPTLVTWYKISSTGSERMQQNKSKTAKGLEYTNLVIDNSTKDDGTTYRCNVYYEHQDSGVRKGEYYITTGAKYGPEVTGANNTLQQFVVGENTQLNCPMDGFPPPELTWYKDGTKLPNGDERLEINDGTLMINGCVKLDAGVYACVGHSDIKPFNATYTTRLSEKFGPRLTTKEKNKTVLALYGHPTVLSCPIEAVPAPTYTWYKDPAKDSMHSSNKNSMEITRFGPADVGMYKCKANNSVTPFTMTYDIWIVRKYAPELTTPDGNNTKAVFVNGRSQTFDCPIDGVPLPTMTWYKNATKLTSGGRFDINPVNGSLKITKLVSKDAGVYKCVGENLVPPAATYIMTLVEEFPPRLTTTEPRRKVLALITEDVVLSCPIEGYPPPEFTWYKDDGNVTNSRRMTLNGATLHITSFLKTDEGHYSCKAKNNVSNVTVTYDIDLIEKFGPRLPVNHGQYEEVEFIVGGNTTTWTCPIIGNPPATLSWYKQSVPFTDKRVIIGSHGVTLTLTNTVKRDAGNYSCIGRNNVPPYNATYYIILREIMAPFLTSSETEIQTVFTAGEPHMFVCPVDGYPKPVITWYKIPYDLTTENFTGEIIEMQADNDTIIFEDIDGNAGGKIYFINATLDDVGVYTCVGRNRVPPYNISYAISSMEKSLVKYPDFARKMQSGMFVFFACLVTLCTICSFVASNYFYDRRFGPEDDNNENEFVIVDNENDIGVDDNESDFGVDDNESDFGVDDQ